MTEIFTFDDVMGWNQGRKDHFYLIQILNANQQIQGILIRLRRILITEGIITFQLWIEKILTAYVSYGMIYSSLN